MPPADPISPVLSLPDAAEPRPAADDDGAHRLPFVSVAIGASAGGVEALARLFSLMPHDTGCCFLIVLHLARDHPSLLASLLGRVTRMPVQQAEQHAPAEANRVYIIPPGQYLQMRAGRFVLSPIETHPPMPMAIDHLMVSLAADQHDNTIGIVLTGGNADGSIGIKAIKGEGGITIAQAPETAAYASMPNSAIATGQVDQQLSIEDIPAAIVAYVGSAAVIEREAAGAAETRHLQAVLDLLHQRLGNDFSGYKTPMLLRRVRRRAGLSRADGIEDYLAQLKASPAEVEALAADFLISVTEFFREPQAWEVLAQDVLPELLARFGDGDDLRVWVPACASGEEAYSMAMLLHETSQAAKRRLNIQVFATDIDRRALDLARKGRYPRQIEVALGRERLQRYFFDTGALFQVSKELRSLVTFAAHNVLIDPPFSRMHLVSCRNLLIYMKPAAQTRVLRSLRFALRPRGILILGKSESIGSLDGSFAPASQRACIFRRLELPGHIETDYQMKPSNSPGGPAQRPAARSNPESDLARAIADSSGDGGLPEAAVVAGRDGQVVYFHGRLEPYLHQPDGSPTAELLALVHPGLRPHLRVIWQRALNDGGTCDTVVDAGDGSAPARPVRLSVRPLQHAGEQRLLLVGFEHTELDSTRVEADASKPPPDAMRLLEDELSRTRRDLQLSVQELESTNEELKVANEEAMSTNEELQSANEELATSKEELESVNEELIAVNQQLEMKVGELEAVNDDLGNLLASTSIPTLFLDPQLRVKRFTPAASRLFQLIPGDLNRPLTDIASHVDMVSLVHDAREVLDHLGPIEHEVRSAQGGSFLRRTMPYRTQDNVIAGVVITFTDISRLKEASAGLQRFGALMKASSDAVVVHDLQGRILAWNRGAEKLYGHTQDEALQHDIFDLLGEPAREAYADEVARVVAGAAPRGVEALRRRRDGSSVHVSTSVSIVADASGRPDAVALIERDISARVLAEVRLRESEMRFRTLADSSPVLIWMSDRDGALQFANRSFRRFVGLSARRLAGRPLGELLHSDDSPKLAQGLATQLRVDQPFEADLRLQSRYGGSRWMKCIAMLRADADRGANEVVGSMVDIDAQVGAQQALRDAARRKDEFLAMLGHELRNPLVPIRNAAAVLDRIAGGNQQLGWVHDVLVRQVGHVTRLVDDLLDISLITQGTMQLHPEPVDLAIAIERAVESARPLIERKQQRLELDLPDGAVWVEGDAIRLVQIFDNLLSNAAKYSDDQGQISIGLSRQGGQALVRVRDNGMGISPTMRSRIFELFVQDERSVDRTQGGLGIGLALVRHLVELHGGTIEAHSEGPGTGSEFTVRLRLLPQDELPRSPRAGAASGVAGGRVLIVEDDPDVGESMAVLLRLYGYQVERAVDLASAKERASSFDPQAVLMDLAMPGADGYEVARRLRAMDTARKDTVYIAVSGFCQAEDLRRSAEAGFVKHLVKPVDPGELDALLRHYLAPRP